MLLFYPYFLSGFLPLFRIFQNKLMSLLRRFLPLEEIMKRMSRATAALATSLSPSVSVLEAWMYGRSLVSTWGWRESKRQEMKYLEWPHCS